MVNEAIEALKVGDREKAFGLLRRHLAANPKDANAWLWMSEAASEPAQQIDALQQVLRLAPTHSRAPMIQKRLQTLLHTTSPQPTLSPSAPPSSPDPAELEQRTGEGLRARLRRESSPSTSLEPLEEPLRLEEPVDLDDWLRTQEEPVHPASPAPAVDFRVEAPAAPTLSSSPVTMSPPPVESPILAERAREETAAPTSPLPRPTPPQDDKMPAWVWGIMLISLILVAAFLFFIWKTSTGG